MGVYAEGHLVIRWDVCADFPGVGTRDGSLLRRASKSTHLPSFSLSLLRSLIKRGSRELPYDFYDCSLSCLILGLYFEEERGKVYLVHAVLGVHSQPRLHRTLRS